MARVSPLGSLPRNWEPPQEYTEAMKIVQDMTGHADFQAHFGLKTVGHNNVTAGAGGRSKSGPAIYFHNGHFYAVLHEKNPKGGAAHWQRYDSYSEGWQPAGSHGFCAMYAIILALKWPNWAVYSQGRWVDKQTRINSHTVLLGSRCYDRLRSWKDLKPKPRQEPDRQARPFLQNCSLVLNLTSDLVDGLPYGFTVTWTGERGGAGSLSQAQTQTAIRKLKELRDGAPAAFAVVCAQFDQPYP